MAPILLHTTLLLHSVDTMLFRASSWLTAAIAVGISPTKPPQLHVPACTLRSTIVYDQSVPDLAEFPLTQVDLCYSKMHIKIDFTAYNETSYFFNSTYITNDPI